MKGAKKKCRSFKNVFIPSTELIRSFVVYIKRLILFYTFFIFPAAIIFNFFRLEIFFFSNRGKKF